MQETWVWSLGREDTAGEGIGYPLQYSWVSTVALLIKNLPAMWETWVQSLGLEDHFAKKGPHSQSYGFASHHVWMCELDHKEGWMLKNWCFWTVVLEKTLVWASSRRWWRTEKPDVLQSMEFLRARHHWVTKQQQQIHSVSFPGFIFIFISVFFSSGHHIIYLLVLFLWVTKI